MRIKKPAKDTALKDITTYQAGAVQASVNRMLQKYCDEILEPFGITKNQWLIIGTVMDAGPGGVRISELALRLGTTLSYLTNTVNLLESKGIMTRVIDSKDGRAKYVYVNKGFVPKTKKIETTLRSGLRQSIYRHIEPKDFKVYMDVLFKLQAVDPDA